MVSSNRKQMYGMDFSLVAHIKSNNQGIDKSTCDVFNLAGARVAHLERKYGTWRSGAIEKRFADLSEIYDHFDDPMIAVSELEEIDE